jgi:hypothetical protein
MTSRILRPVIPLIVAILLVFPAPLPRALADTLGDAAPPAPAPGDSIQSGYIDTKVQMVSEDVLITIGDNRAYVKANFQLRNQGTSEESFNVRFPVGADNGFTGVSMVENFAAYVDGSPAETTTIYNVMPRCDGCDPIPWASWPVTFPPGQQISVDVIYQVPPYRSYGAFDRYYYILQTGAGWYDSIGEADITVRLPYAVNEYNARLAPDSISPANPQIEGTDIVWRLTDFEPKSSKDNVDVELMYPRFWRDLVTAREGFAANPDSLDAHLGLAHALADAMGFDYKTGTYATGGTSKELMNEAIQVYQDALKLAPDSPQLWSEYVMFLTQSGSNGSPLLCDAITQAEAAFPNNPELEKSFVSPKAACQYQLDLTATLGITQSPTSAPLPSSAATSTPLPVTATLETIGDPPLESPSSPCPGAMALMVIPLFSAVYVIRRKRSK